VAPLSGEIEGLGIRVDDLTFHLVLHFDEDQYPPPRFKLNLSITTGLNLSITTGVTERAVHLRDGMAAATWVGISAVIGLAAVIPLIVWWIQ